MPKKKTTWKTFESEDFIINLPDTFIGGQPSRDRKTLKEEVKTLPDDIRSIYSNLFAQRNFAFLAADRAFNNEMTSLSCLVVLPESIPFFQFKSNIERYIRTVKKNLGRSFSTVEEEYFDFHGIPAARLLSAQYPSKSRKNPQPEVARKHLLYVFRLPKHYWTFDFIADASVFDKLKPTFEESIKSLVFAKNTK